jgi:glutaminyl-peptide cyclotransferase
MSLIRTCVLLVCCLVFVCARECRGSSMRRYTRKRMAAMAGSVDADSMRQELLSHVAVPRVVGSEGHASVRNHLIKSLENLSSHWRVETSKFDAQTPLGMKTFTNIVATFNPAAVPERIVFAAHYDSKYFGRDAFSGQKFVGATDSAVPCVLLLDAARHLNDRLVAAAQFPDDWHAPALQLVFFDGEEAFESWTSTDSMYVCKTMGGVCIGGDN